jgi:hypothetical protein
MRVYKFLNKRFALQAMYERRLKIARITEMNDPFEMLPLDLSDRVQRVAMATTAEQLNETAGVLCFSRSWSNPVIWAHYADRHRGICLGFDMPDEYLKAVDYAAHREPLVDVLELPEAEQLEVMNRILFTKFEDWRYEQEMRVSIQLDHDTRENGLYFVDWDDHTCVLTEVIVGLRSETCRRELERALNGYAHPVAFVKARASVTAFAVEASPDGLRNHDDATYFLKRGTVLHPVQFVRDSTPTEQPLGPDY